MIEFEHDSRCVHVDPDSATATFIATWLTSQGIPAHVVNEEVLGGFEGLTSISSNLGYRGAEVWVDDPAHAEKARRLFAERESEVRAERSAALGPVEATCKECGTRTQFPAQARGTVQECPNCAEYMDIPGDIEQWDDAEIDAAAAEE